MKQKRFDKLFAALIILLLLGIGAIDRARAGDIVTEFGVGYKLEGSTSYLLLPACKQAQVVNPTWPDNPRPPPQTYSCGGDNPAFIGWPIAWEHEFSGPWSVRAGWFHYSNWFDGGNYFGGGDRFETHMDLLATTVTFNWSKWRRQRRDR